MSCEKSERIHHKDIPHTKPSQPSKNFNIITPQSKHDFIFTFSKNFVNIAEARNALSKGQIVSSLPGEGSLHFIDDIRRNNNT